MVLHVAGLQSFGDDGAMWVLAWVFLITTSAVNAQTSLRLEQVVDEGLKNSPLLQAAESRLTEAQAKTREHRSGYWPTLTASATYLFDKKYAQQDVVVLGNLISIEQIVPSSAASLLAQWSIFDGFTTTNQYQSSKAMEEAAQNDFEWTRFRLEREISLLFYKSLAAEKLQETAEQNQKALEDHVRDVRLYKKAGVGTDYDLLKAQVQLSNAEVEVLNAKDNVQITKSRLSEAIGRTEDITSLSGSLPLPQKNLIDKIQPADYQERKDLKSLEYKAEAIENQSTALGRHWVPRVSLFGRYDYYNNRNDEFDAWDNYRDAYQVGIQLIWNIFDGFGPSARSRQSIEKKFQLEKQLHQSRLTSQRDLEVWKRKYLYHCSVYETRQKDVERSRESLRLAKVSQRAGRLTSTDVLDAEADLYRSQAGVVQAQIGAYEALVSLELSTGRSLQK